MKKILGLMLGLCTLLGCSDVSQPKILQGRSFILQNAENDAQITLEFSASEYKYYGQVVNNYFGDYKISAKNINFGNGGLTMMMGPQDLMQAEHNYLQDLAKVNEYQLNGDALTLTTSNGKKLVFRETGTK